MGFGSFPQNKKTPIKGNIPAKNTIPAKTEEEIAKEKEIEKIEALNKYFKFLELPENLKDYFVSKFKTFERAFGILSKDQETKKKAYTEYFEYYKKVDELLNSSATEQIKKNFLYEIRRNHPDWDIDIIAANSETHCYIPSNNKIHISVRLYKKLKEAGRSDIEVVFGILHELGHKKWALKEDSAGVKNLLAHFKQYTSYKRINKIGEDGKTKVFTLNKAYNTFYNILEDIIVNTEAKITSWLAKTPNLLADLYAGDFWKFYKKVGDGNGDHIYDKEKKDEVFVGEGKGNLKLLRRQDFKDGINWNSDIDGLENNRRNQYLNFFMLSEMIGVPTTDDGKRKPSVLSESESKEKPEQELIGKTILNDDVAIVFNGTILDAYNLLCKKIQSLDNYYKDYDEFANKVITVPFFGKDKSGNIVELRKEDFQNIPNYFKFKSNIEECFKILGKTIGKDIGKYKLPELLKIILEAKSSKISGLDRIRVWRYAFEPFFTLLSILDGSFDIKEKDINKPDQKPEEGEEGEGDNSADNGDSGDGEGDSDDIPPQDEDFPNDWLKKGKRVFIKESKKSGTIVEIKKSPNGEILSVVVAYDDEKENKMNSELNRSESDLVFGHEEVFNPYESLIPYEKSKKGKNGESKKPPYDYIPEKDENEDEEGDDDPENKGDSDEQDGGDDAKASKNNDDAPSKKNKKPKDNPNDGKIDKKKLSDNLDKLGKKLEKENNGGTKKESSMTESERHQEEISGLEDAIKTQERLEKIKKYMESKEYKDMMSKKKLAEEADVDESYVIKYKELENKVAEKSRRFADSLCHMVENMREIVIEIKEGKRLQGVLDQKDLQRYIPHLENGYDMGTLPIHTEVQHEILKENIPPDILRIRLVVDNSGSMGGEKMESVIAASVLINRALRDFRDSLITKLGFDCVCDIEYGLFGNAYRVIKDFDYDVDDIYQDGKVKSPGIIDKRKEDVSMIRCISKLNAGESTYDADVWPRIYGGYDDKQKNLIKSGVMTDMVIQISDGEISGNANESISVIKEAKRTLNGQKTQNFHTFGFFMGNDSGIEGLRKRHGYKNVSSANTLDELIDGFEKIVEDIMSKQMAKKLGVRPEEINPDFYKKNNN